MPDIFATISLSSAYFVSSREIIVYFCIEPISIDAEVVRNNLDHHYGDQCCEYFRSDLGNRVSINFFGRQEKEFRIKNERTTNELF